MLELVNRVQNHLTAGVVSNDQHFLNEVLGLGLGLGLGVRVRG